MNLTELINHPERMNRETLYDLRSVIALHPYYQTARILMLKNLYILHDPTFDEELRRASIYITDRKVLFGMIEAAHYRLRQETKPKAEADAAKRKAKNGEGSRTTELIDSFLETIPEDVMEPSTTPKRKPTPADAAVDYVAYLLETDAADRESGDVDDTPQLKGHDIIDRFIYQDGGKFTLQQDDEPEAAEQVQEKDRKQTEEPILTETMARIYVRQGRYSQALEIIKHLNLENPKKNAYFADQIRFLEKLIVNNNKKNN